MATEVEFAVVGRDMREFLPISSFYGDFFDSDEDTRPWDKRRRTTLYVEDAEPVESVLARAVGALDLVERDWSNFEEWRPPEPESPFGTGRFMALRDDDSPIPLTERLFWDTVTLVDESGRARWGVWRSEATYGDIRTAASVGALTGNPTQLYLNVRPTPAGGLALLDWEMFLQIWRVGSAIAEKLAVANEVHDLYRKVRDRLAGSKVVESKAEEWIRRNGYAYYIEHMLRGEDWSSFKLAGLLGCTVDEAESILGLYGYEQAEPGKWAYAAGNERLGLPSTDLSARVVRAYTKQALFQSALDGSTPEDELAELFCEIVRQAVEDGRLPELPFEGYEREHGE